MRYLIPVFAFLLIAGIDRAHAQSQPAKLDSAGLAETLAGTDSTALEQFRRRQELLDSALSQLLRDFSPEMLTFDVESQRSGDPFQLDSLDLQAKAQALQDYIGEELRRYQVDPILDFGKLLRAVADLFRKDGRERPSIADLPLPSPVEIDVLSLLWQNGTSTNLDLYAGLDSSISANLTAETFWNMLHDMARRGFVSEKLISPQQLLMVGVGPFSTPVEMSAKNRKNRLFEYDPLVQQDEMLAFLEAKNYLARQADATNGDAGMAMRTERLLMRLLARQRQAAEQQN